MLGGQAEPQELHHIQRPNFPAAPAQQGSEEERESHERRYQPESEDSRPSPSLRAVANHPSPLFLRALGRQDFILFRKGMFKVLRTTKDNTGTKKYTERMVFPTLKFPSDHGIIETALRPSA